MEYGLERYRYVNSTLRISGEFQGYNVVQTFSNTEVDTCKFLFSDPISGFRASTSFMLFCMSEKPEPTYKFSYTVEPNLPVSIPSDTSLNKINFIFDFSADLYESRDFVTVKLQCEIINSKGVSNKAYKKIKVYNRFSDLKQNFNSTINFVEQLMNLTETDLYQQVSLLLNLLGLSCWFACSKHQSRILLLS